VSADRVIPPDDTPDVEIHRIQVEVACEQRLDRFLAEKLSLSRSYAVTLIETGRVRVASRIPKKSYRPEPGDEIVVEIPTPEPLAVEAEDIPVDVLYEDDGFLVVNKPAGLVVHPAPGHLRGTLVNALLHHSGRLSSLGGSRRPGIVHRLDKDTSGLIIVAKDEKVHRRLAEALARRKISRLYLAACWGHLQKESLLIEADVGRHRHDRKRMAVVPGTRPAVTEVWRLERWKAADYLRVRLHTGRTHQIRVHLRHVGHPVVGDRQYGEGWERGLSSGTGRWAKDLARQVPRQFLHAAELSFRHPITGRAMEFEAPLPAELAAAADWARKTS
jgi:23S rRNA pseudouridine1911/1915/1917 synthase